MKDEKKQEPEIKVLAIIFIALCTVVLLSLVVPWGMEIGGYLYAVIALVGVVTCARDRAFMAVDVLLELYPETLKKAMHKVRDIVMILVFAILFVISIMGVTSQIQNPTTSATLGIPDIILYVFPLGIYPISIWYYIRNMKQK